MTAETKTIYTLFPRAGWTREEKKLDALSAEGWQLTARLPGKMLLTRDDTVRYRYAIDFRYNHDEEMYLDLFREDGWECAATVGDQVTHWDGTLTYAAFPLAGDRREEGCWYIFRKAYDPALPERDYAIHTDESSQKEALRRAAKPFRNSAGLFLAAALVYGLGWWFMMDRAIRLPWYLYAAALMLLLAVVSAVQWRQTLKGAVSPPVMQYILLGLWVLGLVLVFFRFPGTSFQTEFVWWPTVFLVLSVGARSLRLFRPGHDRLCIVEFSGIFLFILLFSCVNLAHDASEQAAALPPVTADNTPIHLFLQLDPDLTAEEVLAQQEARDWYMSTYTSVREDPEGNSITALHITVAPYDDSFPPTETGGAFLTMVFDPVTGTLTAATLFIKTDDGTATCYYNPTGIPSLQLTTKSAWYLPQKTTHPETVADAADTIMAVVWPEGYGA